MGESFLRKEAMSNFDKGGVLVLRRILHSGANLVGKYSEERKKKKKKNKEQKTEYGGVPRHYVLTASLALGSKTFSLVQR